MTTIISGWIISEEHTNPSDSIVLHFMRLEYLKKSGSAVHISFQRALMAMRRRVEWQLNFIQSTKEGKRKREGEYVNCFIRNKRMIGL